MAIIKVKRHDPFTHRGNCIDRLHAEYVKHKRLIVAVDFDDTVYPFNNSEDEHPALIDLLKQCNKHNFYVVVFTASSPERYPVIEKFMVEKGITIASINKNPIPLPYGNNGKIYYNILLDDRAGLWEAVSTLQGVINKIEFNGVPEVVEHKCYNCGQWVVLIDCVKDNPRDVDEFIYGRCKCPTCGIDDDWMSFPEIRLAPAPVAKPQATPITATKSPKFGSWERSK